MDILRMLNPRRTPQSEAADPTQVVNSAGGYVFELDDAARLRRFLTLGVDGGTLGRCLDGASETGNGGVGTWTAQIPALAGAPIDHVMASSHWRASTATASAAAPAIPWSRTLFFSKKA